MTTGRSLRKSWRWLRLVFLAVLLSSGGCARHRSPIETAPPSGPYPTAAIVASGAIECFCAGLTQSDGHPATCEISAAVRDGDRLVLGSDKPVPGGSPVFSVPLAGGKPEPVPCEQTVYFTAAPFLTATKYEDMTRTPDGAFLLATTGFDRYDHVSSRYDPYDTLLCWPAGLEGQVKAVNPANREGITSSTGIRRLLSRVQASERFPRGIPYFKVEGLAAVPGERLLFGIREAGKNYRTFRYTVRIIAVTYLRSDHQITLTDTASVVLDLDGIDLARRYGLRAPVGLSSLEYDPAHDRLYMLTSFEVSASEPVNGGYLWILPMSELRAGGKPSLVRQAGGAPLLFMHKPEAVAVLDDRTVIVVHDDDRVMGGRLAVDPAASPGRAANQSIYDVVRFAE